MKISSASSKPAGGYNIIIFIEKFEILSKSWATKSVNHAATGNPSFTSADLLPPEFTQHSLSNLIDQNTLAHIRGEAGFFLKTK